MKLQSPLLKILVSLLLFSILLPLILADLNSDRQALLNFIDNVPHGRNLNWNISAPICTKWAGVTCNNERTRVVGLHLPGIGLVGPIPYGTVGKLDALEILSLRSNSLNGKIPSDILSIPSLRSIFLQSNNFSGSIPDSLHHGLMVLDLSSNSLSGHIPSSINNLTRLIALHLENNLLSGSIPDLNPPRLKVLNVSHNRLDGEIPNSLQKFPSSSFLGNPLCGPPLDSCSGPSPAPASSMAPSTLPLVSKAGKGRKLSVGAIIGIVIGGIAVFFLAMMIILLCCCNASIVEGEGILGSLQ